MGLVTPSGLTYKKLNMLEFSAVLMTSGQLLTQYYQAASQPDNDPIMRDLLVNVVLQAV
jgi:hypothetical protein